MSNDILNPANFRGLTFSSFRTPQWARRVQRSVSGRELVVQDYANPIWTWKLEFSFLRDYPTSAMQSELRYLMDFYNGKQAIGDTFLYLDREDHYATDEFIGVGDAVTTEFQLRRALFGFSEAIISPGSISAVYLDGVVTAAFAVDYTTGIMTFGTAPASGVQITVSFNWYWRVRFVDDAVEFERFAHKLWSLKELRFRSVVL